MEMIFTRLENRRLVPLEINRLIKDVSNIVGPKRLFESTSVKKILKRLGWEEHVLDYRTLELINAFLENDWELEIQKKCPKKET